MPKRKAPSSIKKPRKKEKRKMCECGKHRPSFGLRGQAPKMAKWCNTCKPAHAVNVVKKLCDCKRVRPIFGLPGEAKNKARWCVSCPNKPMDAVDVVSKRCACGEKQPTFGLPGGSRTSAIWCQDCPGKPADAIDVKSKRCKCKKSQPFFGLPGGKPIWCVGCKPADAVDLKSKQCGCEKKTRPIFGLRGEPRSAARWCFGCKPHNAVDIVHGRCDCGDHRPTLGLQKDGIAKYCASCPTLPGEAVDVVNKMCECGTSLPSFGIQGTKDRLWCKLCKKEGAVDMSNGLCECNVMAKPYFGLPGDHPKDARWCSRCPSKPSNAINIVDRKCKCNKVATFGFSGGISECCTNCKLPGMLYGPRRKCSECTQLALYGESTRKRCEEHKEPGDFNLVERKCVSCGLMEVLNGDQKCSHCEPSTYKKYIKRKKLRVKHVLDAHGFGYVQDRIPNGTQCGLERPDFLLDCKTHLIVLEVDEDQHKARSCDCEQKRMVNITHTFMGVPMFWIRYNPDNFKQSDGKKAKVSGTAREKHLVDWIKLAQARVPNNVLEVVYLFYDGCDATTTEADIKIIDC